MTSMANSENKRARDCYRITLLLVILICTTLGLTACQPTPVKTTEDTSLYDLTTHNTDREIPKQIKDQISKGTTTINIDADVIIPDASGLSTYNSDFIDWDDPSMLSELIQGLANGAEVTSVSHPRNDGTEFLWIDSMGENMVSVINKTRSLRYTSSNSGDHIVDTTWMNEYKDAIDLEIGITTVQAMQLAKDTMRKMGLSDFESAEIRSYGVLYPSQEGFYQVVLSRTKDGIRICDPYFQYTDGQKEPLEDSATFVVGSGGVWFLEVYTSRIGQIKEENVQVIGFWEAYDAFKRIGVAQISGFVSPGDDVTLSKIELCYSHVGSSDTDGYVLTPVWAFHLILQIEVGDDKALLDQYILFDAQTGTPLM